MQSPWRLVAFAGLAPWFAPAQGVAPAAGQMMVVPSRLVLADEERTASLTLFNRGSSAAAFDIAIQHFDMDEKGQLQEIHPADAGRLEGLVVVAPARRILLQAGESQVIRVLLRNPQDLAPGEYRVHLTFRGRPAQEAVPVPPTSAPEAERTVQVQTLPGISVPVIIRKGTHPARVSIQDLAESRGKRPGLTLRLCREGDQSVFGDLAMFEVDGQGAERLLASLPGIAVYPSRAFRLVEMAFPEPAPPPGARLRVRFTAKDQPAQSEEELVLQPPQRMSR